jgi:hypothetical protein
MHTSKIYTGAASEKYSHLGGLEPKYTGDILFLF